MIIDTGSDYEFLSCKVFPPFVRFEIDDYLSRLIVSVENPTDDMIENFRKDKIRFRATAIDNAVWLTFKIGDLPIVDAAFTFHYAKYSVDKKSLRKILKTFRIALVDSVTGKTVIQLQYSLSDEFVDELRDLIIDCFNMDYDESNYLRLTESIHRSTAPVDIFNDSSLEFNSEEKTYTQLELNM